ADAVEGAAGDVAIGEQAATVIDNDALGETVGELAGDAREAAGGARLGAGGAVTLQDAALHRTRERERVGRRAARSVEDVFGAGAGVHVQRVFAHAAGAAVAAAGQVEALHAATAAERRARAGGDHRQTVAAVAGDVATGNRDVDGRDGAERD